MINWISLEQLELGIKTDLSNDPDFVDDSASLTAIPVAGRIGLGMRYFFTDNIGINLGVGFGQGGILNGGLSFKF